MPRADNYYDNRFNELSQPGTATQAVPHPSVTQQQIYKNINQQKMAEDAAYWKKEADRHWITRVPYEFANTLYDMPDERDWQENYNFAQKWWHMTKESAKLTGRMIKNLPREVLKAPLRLEQSFYDLNVSLNAIGGRTREDVMNTLQRDESYTLPWLGEVKGFAGSYQEGKEMGLNPFFSGVKATGELAGDIAITYSLVEAGAAATRPRMVKVKGTESVTGKDFRPLTSEQTAKIKVGVSEAGGKTKMVNAEVLTPKQNPNVSYLKIPKSQAARFKGNANNTFMKIRPLAEGQAEYSIVQLRKSLTSQTADWFKAKFGRGAVSTGPLGPELTLQTGVVNYNPYALVKQGGSAEVMTKNAFNFSESSIPSASKAAAARTASPATLSDAYQFYSPNIEESLTFEEAAKRLTSGDQARYKMIGQDIDAQLGHQSEAISAIGDWSDGAENTVFNTIKQVKDFDELRYSTALKGKIGNQKAVIPFMAEEGGADSLYMTEIKGVSMEDLRAGLDEAGIQFRTLAKTKDGIKVVVFDQGTELTTQINNLAQKYDTNIEQVQGRGEFLGSWETRAEGLKAYDEVIKSYEQLPDRQYYQQAQGGRVPDSVSKEAKSIDPFLQEKPEVFYPMKKPLRGFEGEMVTGEQTDKIIQLGEELELDPITLQAVSKALTGKNSIYDLTQAEAYDVSEAVRMIPGEHVEVGDDFLKINRSFTHPARYWMEAAERELGQPIYSEVYLPIETGARVMRVFNDRWQEAAREAFGKYSKPKYAEERRMLTDYIEGNKTAITENKTLTPEVKAELAEVGDWLVEQYKKLFTDLGITSERFFSVYSPKIRKSGGIHNIYKSDDLPVEIKPFFEFEREGMLDPIEDDALALFDIYTRAVGKKTYMHDALENAKQVIDRLPPNLRKATNSYLQEKIGFKDGADEMFNNFATTLNNKTNGLIPKNIFKQAYDFLMTSSYAGALGLPRIMPIFRNSVQVLLTTYPEVGSRYFLDGMKRFYSKEGLAEIQDKGFLVAMGVPYGADLISETGQGVVGRTLDKYKAFNRATMKPYASIDINNRGITYHAVKARFQENWKAFRDGKMTYEQFEKEINMDGFNPTLQRVLRGKFQANTPGALEEAQDLMVMDILDRTQFPYRKGTQSRLHYGVGGKMGLQFGQWAWEYGFTLKSWISRGQWDKLLRWFGMSTAVKRTAEDVFGIDVSKWIAGGPFSGFPLGPIAKMATSAISGVNASFTGMTEEVNKHSADIYRTMQIYGGALTGVGKNRWKDFKESMDKHDAGIAVSPYPDKPYGVWSSTGKIIRWVDFTDLLKIAFGFDTPEGEEQSNRINAIKKESVEYSNNINKAMDYLIRGEYENFDKMVQKHNLMITDISTKLKSYQIPLDQRIYERMPLELKIKYFNAFYPADQY